MSSSSNNCYNVPQNESSWAPLNAPHPNPTPAQLVGLGPVNTGTAIGTVQGNTIQPISVEITSEAVIGGDPTLSAVDWLRTIVFMDTQTNSVDPTPADLLQADSVSTFPFANSYVNQNNIRRFLIIHDEYTAMTAFQVWNGTELEPTPTATSNRIRLNLRNLPPIVYRPAGGSALLVNTNNLYFFQCSSLGAIDVINNIRFWYSDKLHSQSNAIRQLMLPDGTSDYTNQQNKKVRICL